MGPQKSYLLTATIIIYFVIFFCSVHQFLHYCTVLLFVFFPLLWKKFKKSYTERCSDFWYYVLYISFVIISFVDVAFSIRHYRGLTIGFILELLLVCAIPSMTLRCNFSNQIKIFDLKFFLYSYSINNHCTHFKSSIWSAYAFDDFNSKL